MLIMNERFVLKKIKDYLAWRGGEKTFYLVHTEIDVVFSVLIG